MNLTMFDNKLTLHQYVLFGVLVILTLWSLLTRDFVFNISFLWWLLGAMIGFLFVFTDSFINGFLMKPEDALGMKEGLLELLSEKHQQKELVMRSFLFLVVWVILGFLTVTSVTSAFARGFVLGIGTHLVFDLIYDYLWSKERFEQWFWQIKRPLSFKEKRGFVWVVVTVYFILAFRF